jgi:hypothetical protein
MLLDLNENGTLVVDKAGTHSAVLLAAAEAFELSLVNPNVAWGTRIINVDIPAMAGSADGLSAYQDWSKILAHSELASSPPPVQINAAISGSEFVGSNTGGAGVVVTPYETAGVLQAPMDIFNGADMAVLSKTGTNSDVTLNACTFRGHTSGYPAAYIVAPRVLNVVGSLFTNNTGALAVLAAENVTLSETRIVDNAAYDAALDTKVSPGDLAAATVKIQPNTNLRNVSVVLDQLNHTRNHGRQTGTLTILYLAATSDDYDIYPRVAIYNSTFAQNSCDSVHCQQSERAVHLYQIRSLQVSAACCRCVHADA